MVDAVREHRDESATAETRSGGDQRGQNDFAAPFTQEIFPIPICLSGPAAKMRLSNFLLLANFPTAELGGDADLVALISGKKRIFF